MRPLRLDVEGFTVYRDRAVVDFADTDFFALVGPTGSGKSTLLDAVCFALYGTVPRWADQRGVAGVLAPSSSQARVRLVFAASGARYVATRMVSRDGKGRVKTTFAGLQRLPETVDLADLDGGDEDATDAVLGEVLAGTPREMDTAVPDLLGLPYDHFVTCVVLPQGQFAQFLHAKPSERGDILVNLLGLHVYRRIAQRSGERARDRSTRADAAERMLAELGDVDQATVDAAAGRAATMGELRAQVEAEAPVLATAHETAARERQRLAELDAAVAALSAVPVPDAIPGLAQQVADAAEATARAERDLAAAEQAEDEARQAAESAPDPVELRRALHAYDTLAELRAQHETLTAQQAGADQALATAQAEQAESARRLEAADAAYAEAQRGELVGALRPHLVEGDPCPVCEQPVHAVPEVVDSGVLRVATKERSEARTSAAAAERRLRDAGRDAAGVRARAGDVADRVAAARSAVAGYADRAEVEAGLEAAARAQTAVRAAGERVRRLRQAHQRARTAEEAIRGETNRAWTEFDAARDRLAAYGPPAADRGDLAAAWTGLVGWTQAAAAQRREARTGHEEAVRAAEDDAAAAGDRLAKLLAEHDLAVPGEPDASALVGAVAGAQASADAEHRRLAEQLARVARLRGERDTHVAESRVAKALADHLRANNFERWLLQEALDGLVAGASSILSDLSGGQYELGHEDGEFHVVDHHDADLRRPVRTLSGGETFQASLALALALSDQLAGMSSTSTALEAIVLDEGFGTLDSATLETVAATLENLAARGDRAVGVVTHVAELAERVPVRFEVTKDARSAHVTRVG